MPAIQSPRPAGGHALERCLRKPDYFRFGGLRGSLTPSATSLFFYVTLSRGLPVRSLAKTRT